MASLKFSVSVDTYDSNKFHFSVNPSLPIINSFARVKPINLSRLEAESWDTSDSNSVVDNIKTWNKDSGSENLILESSNFRNDIWRRVQGVKRVRRRDPNSKFRSIRNDNGHEEQKSVNHFDDEIDVNEYGIGPELSVERCNAILKGLERCSDSKTMKFFEWMRENGKLEGNVSAYNLALRVLGRRGDWDAAETMIWEMNGDSDCQVNFQVYNTLIYACYKQGHVELGTKWFRLMLENGVRPNVATFGMVMSLYQKGWNVADSEYAFSQMRSFGITCQSAYSAMITIYTRMSLYDKAEEVIDFIQEDKVILNLENWLVLLNAYSQQGKLQEAERVLFSMQNAGFSPNIVAYNMLITGYGKASNMDAAQHIFRNLKNVGLEPDESTYRSMIEGWGRAENYKEAEWYYNELKRLGFKPNSSNLYTMINLQAKYADGEDAARTLDDMKRIGCQYSSVLGTLLQAYERAGRIDRVPQILKGSFYEYVLVNQTSCSILVMAYVKHCLVDDAIKVLQEKQWKDTIFEDNLYHLVICSCKELGRLENAVKIYSQMPNKKPNLHIMCTMIDIYSTLGRFSDAENLYLKLKSSEISLDMIAFSIVVRMYVKSGSLKDACSVLETMDEQKNIVPDIYLFCDMLRIYQQCGMLDKLQDLYYRILKMGVTWDSEMYNCVINCCARALPVDELSRLFDEMLLHGFAPNTITLNVMLDVYGKSRLFKKARKVLWLARKRGLVDVISYNTIIAAYGQSKDLKKMLSTVRQMQFNGFSVSLEVYNCMLDSYGKEGQIESFRSVLRRMKESSCASDHYTYNIMINIYGEQGWIEEVANVLTELKESGLGPDLCSYNTLIKAYGIAGMVEDAVVLVKEMRENGIQPDRITYINLINALRKNDEFLEAVKWSLWMKQMGL